MSKLLGIDFQKIGWETIPILIATLIRLALEVAGFLAIIYLVYGAFHYFMAFGDEGRVKKGKTIMTYAVVGVIVCTLSVVIVTTVWNFFSDRPLPPIIK